MNPKPKPIKPINHEQPTNRGFCISTMGRSSTSYAPCCSGPTSFIPPRGLPERAGSTHRQQHLGQHDAYRVFPATLMRHMQGPHASEDGRTVGLWAGTRMMIVLLLFLQKQNLAFAVYLFGSVLSLYHVNGCVQGEWRQGSLIGFVIDRAFSHT